MRGLFVVLEGPEGAGKSTLARALSALLAAEAGEDRVVLTREPGGTPTSDAVRDVLLDTRFDMAPLTEFLLYSASRAQHVEQVIRPALDAGKAVICDRFSGSSVAYQGAGRGVDAAFVRELNARVSQGCIPDLTILVDIDPELGLQRIASRGRPDRLESADLAFHRRVAESFREQAAAGDWFVLDGTRAQAEVLGDASSMLLERARSWLRG